MLPRFHAPGARAGGSEVLLPDEEAHHATRVMRLKAGDDLAVFDGAGHEWRARIVSATRAAVRVILIDTVEPAPEPRIPLVLAQAVLKGDHMDAVVRDATMIGVARIAPIVTERTVARADPAAGDKARTRWERVALASAKQCGRATLPAIASAATLDEFITGLSALGPDDLGARIVLAEPSADRRSPAFNGRAPGSAILAVGPEGGWSRRELDAFVTAEFTTLTLGALTLRADAAALVAISVLRVTWRDL